MAEGASVSTILEGVAADVDVLAEALKYDSADDYQVPAATQPAYAIEYGIEHMASSMASSMA